MFRQPWQDENDVAIDRVAWWICALALVWMAVAATGGIW